MDPITDMFNRIKNAQAAQHAKVLVPFSGIKFRIAEILHKEGLIDDLKKKGKAEKKVFLVGLKYGADKIAGISGFKKISKPGQRIYKASKDLPWVKSGSGIAIVSTSQGIMTAKEARKKKIGGEVLVEIW